MSAFHVANHGSIVLVYPTTVQAEAWLRSHVSGESQWWNGALVVEPRYLEALLAGAEGEGIL